MGLAQMSQARPSTLRQGTGAPVHSPRPERELPQVVYKLMIVAATIIWGGSFVVMKDAVGVMEPSWLIGIRFLLTAAILGTVFAKRLRMSWGPDLIKGGIILGMLLFGAYWTQTIGLKFTTPGKNAFLTAVYCVIVPFMFWAVAKRKPTIYNIAAAVLCIVGVGFVSLSGDDLTLGFGDGMTLMCSVFFAAHIVATAVWARRADIMALTIIQFAVSGAAGCLVGAFTEPLPNIAAVTSEFLFNMAYLVILASCVALGFQNAAVAKVPPSQAAILLSLESVFGVGASVLFYGEQLTGSLVIGFALILGAVMLSEAFPLKRPPDRIDEAITEDAAVID